jgi:membrane carboxypeptidase/penicillin-binding protein
MQEDKVAGAEAINPGVTGVPRIVPYERPRREAGFHFVDHLLREAKTLVGMQSLTSESYTVRSTINSRLQRATEEALQNGLARYEAGSGRARYEGPELNLGEITARVTTEQSTHALRRGRVVKPVWQIALQSARLPLYDVHWPAAVVLSNGGKAQIKVGLNDGRTVPLAVPEHVAADALHVNDVIYVNVIEGKNRNDAKAELRIRPRFRAHGCPGEQDRPHPGDGGGFSYPLSQLNRTSQALRQPGSSIKPLTYPGGPAPGPAAQHAGAGPPVTLPSIPGVTTHSWTPKNYDSSSWGSITLRRAGELQNLVTARLLDGGIDKDPGKSLEQICDLAVKPRSIRVHQELSVRARRPGLRMIDLAGFYAAIVNEGLRHALCDRRDRTKQPRRLQTSGRPAAHAGGGDRAAFYQLRTILEGVVERGTAASMRHLAHMSAARPAPPTTRTMPGLSASPAT